jgi:hypothetical protein
MNVAKRLRHLAEISGKDRRLGKTTLIAKAAKELDGILLTNSFSQATLFEENFGVVSKCVYQNLDLYNGPFFFDHCAVELLLLQAAKKIEDVEKELTLANNKIESLKEILTKVVVSPGIP